MNQFSERYKLKTNSELIRIIQNDTEYQKLAVEAAKKELSNRGVTENDVNESEIVAISKTDEVDRINSIFKRFNTYINNNTTEDNIILSLSIPLVLWSIFSFYYSLLFLKFAIKDVFNADFSVLFFLAILILPSISTFLFLKRKRIGWVLLVVIFTYSILESVIKFLNTYLYDKNLVNVVLPSIIYGLLLYFLCKSNIRSIYDVKSKLMINVIGWTLGVLIMVYIYLLS